MPLSHEGNQRSFRENLLLALTLSGVAGAVNAVGFAQFGWFTTHLTGAATEAGISAATGDTALAKLALGMLGAFLFGAMLATVLIERAKIFGGARYRGALLIEAMLLTGFALFVELAPNEVERFTVPLTMVLSFSMGMQNALVTKISGAVVRTTHVTGLATDMGIEIVRLVFWVAGQSRQKRGLTGRLSEIYALGQEPEFYKVRLLGTILLSFISGVSMATMLYRQFGVLAMLGPVVIVLALVLHGEFVARRPHSDEEETRELRTAGQKLD